MTIDGIKLIKHNMAGVNNPDDPSFGPFRLDARFRVPSFMEVAAAFIYGNEEVVVRGKTREALEQFSLCNKFATHPRLIRVEITEPEKSCNPPNPASPSKESMPTSTKEPLSTKHSLTPSSRPFNTGVTS